MRTILLSIIILFLVGVGAYWALDKGVINLDALNDDSVTDTVPQKDNRHSKLDKKDNEKKKAKKNDKKSAVAKAEKKEKIITDASWPVAPVMPTEKDIALFDLNGPYGNILECSALMEEKSYKKHKSQMFMVPGYDHWIFRTRQDFEPVYKFREKKAELYRIFADVLRHKGTELVIAYIPPRAVMAESKIDRDNPLSKDIDLASIRTEFYGLLDEFQKLGVNLVSIPYASDGDKYFNWADHHWNTQGSKAMALEVSSVVKATDRWRDIDKQAFETVKKGAVAYDGLYGKVTREICGFVPYPERDYVYKTSPVEKNKEDGLFGDSNPSVTLIGTSNSKRGEFDSNFDGFLKEELSLDVYNAALSGGGMDDSVIQYLESDVYKNNQPAFLIWELPSYYNLGGYGMEMALRRATPAALGSCKEPILTFGPEPITGKRLRVVSEIEKQKIKTEHTYLEMRFERPIKKDFSISVKTTDRKTELFKFESPHEGKADHFFFLLKGERSDSFLYSVGINNSQNYLEGVKVSGKLCALPDTIVPAEEAVTE